MTKAPTTAAVVMAALMLSTAALAQPAAPPGPPPGLVLGAPNPKLALAGHYAADPSHTAIVARVSHIGYSFSVFRFGVSKTDLQWDPAAPERSTLSVTVPTSSIQTPVKDFPAELSGPQFLNSAAFPDATFVSTTFHPTSSLAGKVDGQFTLMGKTRPMTMDVTLIGAGPGFGHPRMGVHAVTTINPKDYGLPPMFSTPIELTIDSEFAKTD